MIEANRISVVFAKTHPNLKIIKAAVYDDRNYIIEAVEDEEGVDFNSPFYLMDKNSGLTEPFSPLNDLSKFHTAFRDNLLTNTGG